MRETSKRSTIYFEPELHTALRLKAAHSHRSVSDIVNEAVRAALAEDQEDLASFERGVSEPTMTYEELLNDLKNHGKFSMVFKKSAAEDLLVILKRDVARILERI